MTDNVFDSDLITEGLADNTAALPVRIEQLIVAQSPSKAVVACGNLQVEHYARLDHCQLRPAEEPRASAYRYWGGEDHNRLYTSYEQVVWDVTWNKQSLEIVHFQWHTACGNSSRDWVVADSVDLAEEFILDVERKTHAPGDAILVFSDGDWQRSYDLYQATQAASFDDLILADEMKDRIRQDFSQFLEAERRYQSLGIAWRRGALMIGPPGNGKTHCVRALVKELGISSLYVQSLSHPYYEENQMWKRVFDRARGLTPCILVLEDLDTLVSDENRSFFLNQLDGFEQNHGLVVLATTNYPERIDSAIIDRPSRFDRKYHFHLPTEHERVQYLLLWQDRLADETGWAKNEIAEIAAATESYSFAYLKELVISAVLEWMQEPTSRFLEVLQSQLATLQRQMRSDD